LDRAGLVVATRGEDTRGTDQRALMVRPEGVTPVDDKRAIATAIADHLEGLTDSAAMLNAAEGDPGAAGLTAAHGLTNDLPRADKGSLGPQPPPQVFLASQIVPPPQVGSFSMRRTTSKPCV